jgi:hypothetical protein
MLTVLLCLLPNCCTHRGQLWVYSNYRTPIAVLDTDIKAGGCVIHTINRTLVPPSEMRTMEGYAGERLVAAPKSEWAPDQKPLPETPKPDSAMDHAASGSSGGPAADGSTKKASAAQHCVLHAAAGVVTLAAMLLL